MTFNQFYQEVIRLSLVYAERKYVRILWDNAYSIEQAVHNLKTMNN
jgi:hypothetical protein